MRKSRARAIRAEELQNPGGMSSASLRAARRKHSHGLNRVPQPKSVAPIGHPGFPSNTVQTIETWIEKQPRVASVTTQVIKTGKGKNEQVKRIVTPHYRKKAVTRVVSTKKK